MLPYHEKIRCKFPGVENKVFLDAASLSIASLDTNREINEFLEGALLCSDEYYNLMETSPALARSEIARLIGAQIEEIAIMENTTSGLNHAASAIPFVDGDNVVICDLEYLQVAIPFYNICRTKRIEVRPVHHKDGIITPDDFVKVCNSRTRAIVVSSVQWCNGLKVDLAALSEISSKHGSWLIVDAIQQIGASKIDISKLKIDFLACGGHKWLNAPFGCGFLFVARERLENVDPIFRGYLTLENPEDGWDEYYGTPSITPFREYNYVSSARKFEVGGMPNYPGIIGIKSSISQINDIGITAIENHIYNLSQFLIDNLNKRGLRVITPYNSSQRAGIVVFQLSENHSQNRHLARFLLESDVYVSLRYTSNVGGVRVSVHFYNNREDIENFLLIIDFYLSQK